MEQRFCELWDVERRPLWVARSAVMAICPALPQFEETQCVVILRLGGESLAYCGMPAAEAAARVNGARGGLTSSLVEFATISGDRVWISVGNVQALRRHEGYTDVVMPCVGPAPAIRGVHASNPLVIRVLEEIGSTLFKLEGEPE